MPRLRGLRKIALASSAPRPHGSGAQNEAEFEHQAGLDRERLDLLVEHSKALVNNLQDKAEFDACGGARKRNSIFPPGAYGRFRTHRRFAGCYADLHEVRVRAYIDEPELGQLKAGQTVVVTWDALPGRTWNGKTKSCRGK